MSFRIVPTFYKFVSLSGVVGIDGFLYELPGEQFAANVEVSCSAPGFYLFLDDLKRSNQHHIFLMDCVLKTVQKKK